MRGTLGAAEFAEAISAAARARGATCTVLPLSDGGEGFASLFGGRRIDCTVEGPLGQPTDAGYFLRDSTAFIEMAEAAGRALLPDPVGDEPIRASTRGVGQLILSARDRGATRIIVGCGGSATTDGGEGCVEVVKAGGGLRSVELVGATDVTTRFLDAARVFGPQKGASASQVVELSERLERLAARWKDSEGIDVTSRERTGAAGGFGGGLVVLGAHLTGGFDVVAEELNLLEVLRSADVVVTGEGRLDATTLEGKSVASLLRISPNGTRVLIIAGAVDGVAARDLDPEGRLRIEICDLTERFGEDAATRRTGELVTTVVQDAMAT